MPVLEKIFNPVSDTYLVLEETTGFRGKRKFDVYRQSRSADLLDPKLDTQIGARRFSEERTARKRFERRLVEEAGLSIRQLYFGYREPDPEKKPGPVSRFLYHYAMDTLASNFGREVFEYDLTDAGSERLYNFEDTYFQKFKAPRISRKFAKKIIAQVADEYGFATPTFEANDDVITSQRYKRPLRGSAFTEKTPYHLWVRLEHGMVDKRILLHELAHLVVDNKNSRLTNHGPHFAAAVTKLYDDYIGLNRAEYFKLANDPRFMVFGPEPVSAESVFSAAQNFKTETIQMTSIARYITQLYEMQTYSPVEPS